VATLGFCWNFNVGCLKGKNSNGDVNSSLCNLCEYIWDDCIMNSLGQNAGGHSEGKADHFIMAGFGNNSDSYPLGISVLNQCREH